MAPKGLISCRRAENIHGSLKSGQVHPFLPAFLPSRMALRQTVTRNTTPPLFFSLSFFFSTRPWRRSFNPRQTVRYIYIPVYFPLRLKNPIKIPSPLILYTPSSRNERAGQFQWVLWYFSRQRLYLFDTERDSNRCILLKLAQKRKKEGKKGRSLGA